jgi:hypothetical protein
VKHRNRADFENFGTSKISRSCSVIGGRRGSALYVRLARLQLFCVIARSKQEGGGNVVPAPGFGT